MFTIDSIKGNVVEPIMASEMPSISTDQLAALVEVAKSGSLRSAAAVLHVTEQGVRNRLLALEARLATELYHKRRGPRTFTPLTRAGERLLPRARAVLEQARRLTARESAEETTGEIHVAATQYLTSYLMIAAVRAFHRAYSGIRVRLSTKTERDIEDALRRDPELSFGVAAPYESGSEFEYRHWLSLDWGLIAPLGHPFLRRRRVSMADLVDVPLIVFERGSTGRQHVLDAFHGRGLSPRIDMEATTTSIVVQMVEAGLGVSLVPLVPGGAVTRRHRVGVRPIAERIAPIHSGILVRRGERLSPTAEAFVRFLLGILPGTGRADRSSTAR